MLRKIQVRSYLPPCNNRFLPQQPRSARHERAPQRQGPSENIEARPDTLAGQLSMLNDIASQRVAFGEQIGIIKLLFGAHYWILPEIPFTFHSESCVDVRELNRFAKKTD